MSIESLTYTDLASRLGTNRARSRVRRLRLPRQTANDGTVRINIDLSEMQCKPLLTRSPGGHPADFDALKAQIEQLQIAVAKLETENSFIDVQAAGHRADFERERERCDQLMANTMSLAAVAMSARAKAARLESELTARRSRVWFRPRARLEQRQTPPARQVPTNELLPSPKVAIMQLERVTRLREPQLGSKLIFAEIAALLVYAGLLTVFAYGVPYQVH
jgi:hypothetical protein